MKIVLKPGGVVLIVMAMSLLTYLAFSGEHGKPQTVSQTPPPAVNSREPIDPKKSSQNLVSNGDFEGDFAPVVLDFPKTNSIVKGKVASNWADNSAWADITAKYSRDETKPHSGKACQKIEFTEVRAGRLQFAHYFGGFPGRTLKAEIWLRAEKPTSMDVVLRSPDGKKVGYGSQSVTVSTEWQHVEFTARITEPDNLMLVVGADTTGTIWVDDASLVDVTP